MVAENFTIPRFAEPISAGFPSPAEGYEDDGLDLHAYLVRNPAATFLHRLRGDVLHEHLLDNSILVVDRSVKPIEGRLILAEANGRRMILRLRSTTAERYPDLICCGVVVGVVLRF